MGWTMTGRSCRVIASLLVLVSLWSVPHRQADDVGCLTPIDGEHDASKHVFGPAAPAEDEHCAVCHWMRGLKPHLRGPATVAASLDPADALPASASATHRAPLGAQLPARAPPVG